LAVVQGYNEDLLATLLKYIQLRRTIASRSRSGLLVDPGSVNGMENSASSSATTPKDFVYAPSPTLAASDIHPQSAEKLLASTPLTPFKRTLSNVTPRTPTPTSIPPERLNPPQTSREMLSHMAWLSEEILRASQEKVNLAQAAYDSVSRSLLLICINIHEEYRWIDI
jgi:hypothetical protein